MEPAADIVRQLREADLRVTAPRVAVLGVLAEHPHSTAQAVAELTRARLGTVSTQAVYDVLAAFTAAGLVRRIEPAGSRPVTRPARATTTTTSCAAVRRAPTDVDCAVGASAVRDPRPTQPATCSTRPRSCSGDCAPTARRDSGPINPTTKET